MQNEATNTPQTFVVVGGNMLRNMMKNSGDACPILLGWWEKLDSKSEVFLVQAMFSKKLQIIAFFQMQLKRLPCPSGGYWSCSRASHVQFPLLHTPTHCRSDCGWFFLKGIRLYMWAHKTLCQQSCWPGTFCVEAMTFQLYLIQCCSCLVSQGSHLSRKCFVIPVISPISATLLHCETTSSRITPATLLLADEWFLSA